MKVALEIGEKDYQGRWDDINWLKGQNFTEKTPTNKSCIAAGKYRCKGKL